MYFAGFGAAGACVAGASVEFGAAGACVAGASVELVGGEYAGLVGRYAGLVGL